MQFKVLGPLEVIDPSGRSIELGGAQSRAVLAMLLVSADRVVPLDAIVERLWPDGPPGSATSTLQSYVSRLRRALDRASGEAGGGTNLLTWESTGYRLHAHGEAVDFIRFESGADSGRALLAQGEAATARDELADALALWRGPALQEFADLPWARGIATRLDERRLAALEDRIRADLLLGRHEVLIGELSGLVDEHPLREGLWEHLAVALYRSGRQAEALRALDDLRKRLVDNLGVDPSPRIRELESQILDHDPSLAPPVSASALVVDDGSALGTVVETDGQFVSRRSRHFPGIFTDEMVGRAAERRLLTTALASARGGRTQWVLIEGEPGIGKTRLMEFVAEEAHRQEFEVLWGRSYESGATPAFWPWLGVLRGICDAADPLPSGMQDMVDRLLSSDSDATLDPVDVGRYRLFEALSMLIEKAARRRPLMFALDDLQWADPASLELIEFLCGHMLGAPVLIVATVRQLEIGRNDAVVQATASISRRPTAHRIILRGVSADESAALVRQAIGDDVSPALVHALHQRSEGNPFFIGELARLVVAEPGLSEAELVRRAGIPASVRDVVHRRLGSLPAATTSLVQMMATIGRETQLGLLSRASGLPLDRCIDDLDPALVSRLIIDVPEHPGTVRFTHALIREVVLDDMSLLRRSRLHLTIADAIEATSRLSDDTAEILAEHLWQAVSLGVADRAARALERAAEVALRRYAYRTADDLLDRALVLRQGMLPEDADLDAELDTINRLLTVRRLRFGFERARMNSPIERAKELARKTSRDRVLAEVVWTDWAGAATSCDLVSSERLARDLVALAEVSDDLLIQSTGYAAWGIHCWHIGRITEAVEFVDRAVGIADVWAADNEPIENGAVTGLMEHLLLTRGFQVVYHALAGIPWPGGSPLPDLARRQSDPYARLLPWVSHTLSALIIDDLEMALDGGREACTGDLGENFEFFSAGAVCLLGCALVDHGDAEEGVRTVTRGVEQYTAVGVLTLVPFYLAAACRGHVALGELGAARDAIERAGRVLEQSHELWQVPFIEASRALLRHAEGAPDDEVAAVFAAARDTAVEQGAHGSAAWVLRRAASIGIDVP